MIRRYRSLHGGLEDEEEEEEVDDELINKSRLRNSEFILLLRRIRHQPFTPLLFTLRARISRARLRGPASRLILGLSLALVGVL